MEEKQLNTNQNNMKYYKINNNNAIYEIKKEEYDKLRKKSEFIFETNDIWIIDLYRDEVGPIVQGAIIESTWKSYIAKQIQNNIIIMAIVALIWFINLSYLLTSWDSVSNQKIYKELNEKINHLQIMNKSNDNKSYKKNDNNFNNNNNTVDFNTGNTNNNK